MTTRIVFWWREMVCAVRGHDPILRMEQGRLVARCSRCDTVSAILEALSRRRSA